MVGVGVEQVELGAGAPPARRVDAGLGHRLDVVEARVLPDRLGRRQAHLDAVVLGRVVARREHRRRGVEVAGGEVGDVGGGHAEVDDVEALVEHALGEGRRQLHAGGAHVAGDEHPGGAVVLGREAGEGGADALAVVGVELAGAQAADVVGLEDGVEVTHGPGHDSGASVNGPSTAGHDW